jgi:dethiobiotin synthetase
MTQPRLTGIVLLGTDTGVGKTTLALALLHAAAQRGTPWIPFKPAETGCAPRAEDATALLAASGLSDISLDDVCPHRFGPPVAPLLAARLADVRLQLPALVQHARRLASRGGPLLVETAGGLLSPYALDFVAADLCSALNLPSVLVARNGLGTINHTCLALQELARRQIPPAAVVLMDVDGASAPDRAHNAEIIHELTGAPVLASLPHLPGRSPAAVASALVAANALEPLLRLGRPVTG